MVVQLPYYLYIHTELTVFPDLWPFVAPQLTLLIFTCITGQGSKVLCIGKQAIDFHKLLHAPAYQLALIYVAIEV